jgi:hypothetical protein
MATKKEINEHLKIALEEIGAIKPWFDKEIKEWVFSHDLYPVEYSGDSKEEVIANYPKYLREFIRHRLNDRVEELVEKKTKGRGGARPGAGRPSGSKRSEETKTIRVKVFVARWIKEHESDIEGVIAGEKKIVAIDRSDENMFVGAGR